MAGDCNHRQPPTICQYMLPVSFQSSLILSILIIVFSSCQQREEAVLTYLPANQTGIHFSNDITENDSINILDYHYAYNGGGVGIGDFNNDGWEDVIFTGNQVASKIYLNKGNFKFEDITQAANFHTKGWATGVSVVDINADGWLDIYISVGGKTCDGACPNQFFIHQGLDKNGIPQFEERAANLGLSDGLYTQQAAFFDFDKDGDLDVYLLRNVINMRDKNEPSPKRYIHPSTKDALFRNDSNDEKIQFTDVSEQLGITSRGYGLGIAINDFNQDGWDDIYVANDFLSPDLMYLNQQTKNSQHLGFKEVNDKVVGHTTYNSMGVVATDVNNDALPDIFVVDMLPNYNERQKTMVGFMNYNKFIMAQEQGYTAQFMRNTLQVHNGIYKDSILQFSEVGYFANIYNTDWSWAPVFADFDNDGDKDLYITNGYVKDITDLDFINYNNNSKIFGSPDAKKIRLQEMLEGMKGIKINNFLYENEGKLNFNDRSSSWITAKESYSNGAATADLDNDGDLDMVVNNINDKAFIIQNNTKNNNYLKITAKGNKQNLHAIGSKITIWHNGNVQTHYIQPTYGYLSSSQTSVHFGLGNIATVDSLLIRWHNGKTTQLYDIKANQRLSIDIKDVNTSEVKKFYNPYSFIFKDITNQTINSSPKENLHTDYNNQRLLLRQYSRQGPCLVAANVDGQAGDEIFIGGARNQSSQILFEQTDGSWLAKTLNDEKTEATNALFVDIDNDGDSDLYVVNGSSEVRAGADYYQDKLYINDGKGNFEETINALPPMKTSTSVAVAFDFDKDGDQDIFIGGRLTPHQYPRIPRSYLLENKNGKFEDITPEALQYIGMVTDALTLDYDNDSWEDLVLVGEWMPLTLINNKAGKLTTPLKLAETAGMWNSIAASDFDKDGDLDLIAGNQGWNTRLAANTNEPLFLFTGDWDENGSPDPLIGHFYKNINGDRKCYALHARDDVTQQIPALKNRLIKYIDFGNATFNELIQQPIDNNNSLIINQLGTSYFQNKGNGKFNIMALPTPCQWAPVQSILVNDFDNDGHPDALIVGNDYTAETNGGWHDALTGIFLKGDGKGHFEAIPSAKSGFYSPGDNRNMITVNNRKKETTIWVGRNMDKIKVFTMLNRELMH